MGNSSIEFSYGYNDVSGKWISTSPIISPSLQQMLIPLMNLEKNKGSAGIYYSDEPDFGVIELNVNSNGYCYLLTLRVIDEKGFPQVRARVDNNTPNVLVEFEGELYPSRAVITDFEFVKKVFADFLLTGTVSQELMN